jgi:SAM-dependent methyltransferase
MFALSEADLEREILDCGGGPASFTAEMARHGRRVISCDPLYAHARHDIEHRIEETYPEMVRSMEEERDRFVWDYLGSPARVGEVRMDAMRCFLDDYEVGRAQGRYLPGELPELPFQNAVFDIALCSHLLFLYADQLSPEFHLQSVLEMLRVARQVRIFPLLNLRGEPFAQLGLIVEQTERLGMNVQIRNVEYEFQRGGNQMLVVTGALPNEKMLKARTFA